MAVVVIKIGSHGANDQGSGGHKICYRSAAEGIDGISVSMLKKSLTTILKALQQIFNTSQLSGVFPIAWKHAIVAPIHKKGDLFDLSHYRPISLLPIMSKVFEKLANAQLRDYLNTNNIIHEAQHGFRQLRNCQTALL